MNSERLTNHPKNQKLPDVNIRTNNFFYKIPYPVTREVSVLYDEEEAVQMRKIESIIEKQFSDKLMVSNSENQSAHMPLEKHKVGEEPVVIQLTENESNVIQISTHLLEHVSEEKKTPMKLADKNAVEKSIGLHL